MSSGRIEVKSSTRRLARVNSTFSRLQPSGRLMGPKFWRILVDPLGSPNVVEIRIQSRSSPWTFSRFLMKNGHPSDCQRSMYSWHLALLRGLSSSSSSTRSRCVPLRVTTPRLLRAGRHVPSDGVDDAFGLGEIVPFLVQAVPDAEATFAPHAWVSAIDGRWCRIPAAPVRKGGAFRGKCSGRR